MSDNIARRIARFGAGLDWEALPPAVHDRARDRFLDAMSTGIAGRDIDVTQVARKAVAMTGAAGACTSLVDDVLRPAGDAALVNGTSVHSILYEDINITSADHPGPVIVPACLAVAEERAAQGKAATLGDVLMGIVVGYEVELALGAAMARAVIERGLRTTSIFGAVGAAAGAAKVYRLGEAETAGAVDMGANSAFGLLECLALTGNEMYLEAGMAGRSGILSAQLGAAGVGSSPVTFEGRSGYFNAFGPLSQDFAIGDAWRIMDVWCKAYPLSGGKQRAADAGIAAWQAGVRPQDIRRVRVKISPGTLKYPGADFPGPFTNFTQGQNSTQFIVAAALLGRDMREVSTFMNYADADIAAFIEKIELVPEDSRAGSGAEELDIEMVDGSKKSFEVEWAEGRVATVDKMAKKLARLAKGFWPDGTAAEVAEMVKGDAGRPIGEVSEVLRRRA